MVSIQYKYFKKWPFIEICLLTSRDGDPTPEQLDEKLVKIHDDLCSLNFGDFEVWQLTTEKKVSSSNRYSILSWFLHCLEKEKKRGGSLVKYLKKYSMFSPYNSTFLIAGKAGNNDKFRWLAEVFNCHQSKKNKIIFLPVKQLITENIIKEFNKNGRLLLANTKGTLSLTTPLQGDNLTDSKHIKKKEQVESNFKVKEPLGSCQCYGKKHWFCSKKRR